jgi:hypothetical protein
VAASGFTRTYNDVSAESDNATLPGKQSVSFRTSPQLLIADDTEHPLTATEQTSPLQFQNLYPTRAVT